MRQIFILISVLLNYMQLSSQIDSKLYTQLNYKLTNSHFDSNALFNNYKSYKIDTLLRWGLIAEYNRGYSNPKSLTIGLYNAYEEGNFLDGPLFLCDFDLSKKFRIGPRIGYYYNYFFGILSARGSIGYYTDFKYSSIDFIPEIGISIATFVAIYWGYNLPIYNGLNYKSEQRLTFSIGLGMINKIGDNDKRYNK